MFNFIETDLGLKALSHVPNIHPLFVHFPIALLLTSFFFYVLALFFWEDDLSVAGKWTLLLGTLAAAATVWTGVHAMSTVSHSAEVHEMMETHEHFGFIILGLSIFLSLWVLIAREALPYRFRWLFLSGLLILSLLIVQSGDIGARMVFLKGVAVQSASPHDGGPSPEMHHEGHVHS